MENQTTLGRTGLKVPRLGLGAMVWGQPKGMARWTPAQMSYGPSHGAEEEEQALEASLAAGVNLIDTAAMYSNGASEKRVGELTHGKEVVVATKFPPVSSRAGRFSPRAGGQPGAPGARLRSTSTSITSHPARSHPRD